MKASAVVNASADDAVERYHGNEHDECHRVNEVIAREAGARDSETEIVFTLNTRRASSRLQRLQNHNIA